MPFFNFILEKAAYLFIILFFSVLFLLTVLTFLSPHVKVVPMLGISECKSYNNGLVDPNSCNVLPGSLGILVLKDSPLFSYVSSPNKLLRTLSLYFLVTTVVSVVASIIFFVNGRYILSILFLASAIAFGILSVIFYSQYSIGDLICYSPPEKNYMICHTLVKVDENYVYTASSRYGVLEKVPKEWIVGKVAYILPPIYGKFVYILYMLSNTAADIYSLITKGSIPKKLTVYYITEP